MKLSDVIIDNSTLGSSLKVVETKPIYEYADGKRTTKIKGYKYTVVMPDRGYDRIEVKIEGSLQLDVTDNPIDVTFDGLELYIFWYNGAYTLGAKATAIRATKKG